MNVRTGLDLLGYLVEPRRENEDLAEYRDRLLQIGSEVLNRSFLDEEGRVKWQEARQTELRGRTGDENLQLRKAPPAEFDTYRFTYVDLEEREKVFRWPKREARGNAPRFGEATVDTNGVANPDALRPSTAKNNTLSLQQGYVVSDDRLWYVHGGTDLVTQQVPVGTEKTVILPWHVASDHAHTTTIIDEERVELKGEDDHTHVLNTKGEQVSFSGPQPHTHKTTPIEPTGPVFAFVHPIAPTTPEENSAPGNPFYETGNLLHNPSFESPLSTWQTTAGVTRSSGLDFSGGFAIVFNQDGTLSQPLDIAAQKESIVSFSAYVRGGQATLSIETDRGVVERTATPGDEWVYVDTQTSLLSKESIVQIKVVANKNVRVDQTQVTVHELPESAQSTLTGEMGAFEVPMLEPVDVTTQPDNTGHVHHTRVAPGAYWSGDFILPGDDHIHHVEDYVVQGADEHNHTIRPPTVPQSRPLYPVLVQVENEQVAPREENPHMLQLSVEKGWTVGRVPGGIPGQIVLGFPIEPEGEIIDNPPRAAGNYGLTPPLPPAQIHTTILQKRAGYPFQMQIRVEDKYTGGVPDVPVEITWLKNTNQESITRITNRHGETFVDIPTDYSQDRLNLTLHTESLSTSFLVDLLDFGEPTGYGFDYGRKRT